RYVKKPSKQAQKLQNIRLAFSHLQSNGVSLLGIDPNDIEQGDLDQVLALLWAIICHYHLRQGDNDGERPLLEWLRSAVQDPEIPDLASSWNNGVNLSALVDYCQPGLIPDHASLD
ncbi:Filamin-A, partial [Geodia barretti]